MAIVCMRDLLNYAYTHKFAIGAFDIFDLASLEATLHVAQENNAPVILNISESQFDEFQFEMLMAAAEAAARRVATPVAIHLNDASTMEMAVHAIRLGCNSILLDTSYRSLHENIESSTEVVKMASECGVSVEGSLPMFTDISQDELEFYAKTTDIDFLFLSTAGPANFKSSQAQTSCIEQLKFIGKSIAKPLSINAVYGLTREWYEKAIKHGLCKVNFDASTISTLSNDNPGAYLRNNGNISSLHISRCIHALGSKDRAAEILEHCTPWSPLEHLIIYNVNNSSECNTQQMMKKGQELLSTIPGVQRVDIGQAILSNAQYRYTWLVRFCHPKVIDSYRDHPVHVAFANELFRPVASDRISIDYQII